MAGGTVLQMMSYHPAAQPVAWFELDETRPDTAERIGQFRQAGLERCDRLEALLAREDVDAIMNITPHYAHAETTLAAARSGKLVICEKPPACSREECDAMVAAAQHSAQPVLVHFQHILRPGARWLGRLLRSGELGRIQRVKCLSLWWRSPEYFRRVDWAGKKYFDGKPTFDGAMANQTVHYINQMLNLADCTSEAAVASVKDLRSVLYRFNDPALLEVEDTAIVSGRLDTADETEFYFAGTTAARGTAGPDRMSEYYGHTERHQIVFECERGTARWWGPAEVIYHDGRVEKYDRPDGEWPFYYHVQQVLAGREEPVTPIAESARTMEFIFRAYEAAGEIRQADWSQTDEVESVLNQCCEYACLPEELDAPPSWA
jgi:predicted dehydrogenase